MRKKAQSEIITTILIILLVLAAIVIVWQVVQGTIRRGGEQVTSGAECMGFQITLTNSGTTVNAKPSKDVNNIRTYQNGALHSTSGPINAYGTYSDPGFASGNKVTSAGNITLSNGKYTWCDGQVEITIP